MESHLQLSDVNVHYDKMHVLHDVSLSMGHQGPEYVALLGRNGVGKTTTLRAISGLTPPSSGSIRFGDHQLHKLPAHQIARLGISHVLQSQNVFPRLPVAENLRFNLATDTDFEARLKKVFSYFPNLEARLRQPAGTLSGGERQMLAIARAWLAQPRVILLDEPTAGLMPRLVWQVAEVLRDMHETSGMSILLVEQNIELALRFSDRVYIMEKGSIVFEASTSQITTSDILPFLTIGASHGR